MPRKIILSTQLALGDIVAFTAAVRELHNQYPGQFVTDVRTPFPQLWEHNPYITPVADDDPDAELIDCHYSRDAYWSVNRSNQHPIHLLHAYCQDVANSLGLPSLHPATLKGDIHLSKEEWGWKSFPHEHHNCQRYWVVCAGGKTDFPTKWWPHQNYQRVVDYFAGRIQFVQIGLLGEGHVHAPLNGAIDLRGQTDIRQLIRVVHAACGVLCGITAVMHLAAAVPVPVWQKRPRPCVVIGAGRESPSWYRYPTHIVESTVGTLRCCAEGGCWQSHVHPVTGEERLCERVVNNAPKCQWMVRPESVVMDIERYLDSEGIE